VSWGREMLRLVVEGHAPFEFAGLLGVSERKVYLEYTRLLMTMKETIETSQLGIAERRDLTGYKLDG
jgi:hypothetical protein